jgi:hypothetical protein
MPNSLPEHFLLRVDRVRVDPAVLVAHAAPPGQAATGPPRLLGRAPEVHSAEVTRTRPRCGPDSPSVVVGELLDHPMNLRVLLDHGGEHSQPQLGRLHPEPV